MKQFGNHLLASLPYVALLGLLLQCPPYAPFALGNALIQAALLLFVVIIPALRTGRMSYVDIGWPVGLVRRPGRVLQRAKAAWVCRLSASYFNVFPVASGGWLAADLDMHTDEATKRLVLLEKIRAGQKSRLERQLEALELQRRQFAVL